MSARWVAPEPKTSRFVVDRCAGDVVLTLTGEIDIANIDELERHLDAVAFSLPAKVVVDVADLAFIDGRGASALMATAEALAVFGTSVVFRYPRPAVRRLLELVARGPVTIEL